MFVKIKSLHFEIGNDSYQDYLLIKFWHENAYHYNNQPSVERLYYTQPYQYNSSMIYPNAIQQNDLEMNTVYHQTVNNDNKNNSPIDTTAPVPFLRIPYTSNTISNINNDTNSMNPSNLISSSPSVTSTILPSHCTTSNASVKSTISNKTKSIVHFHDIPTGNNDNRNQNEVVKSEASSHDSFLNDRHSMQWDILVNNGMTTSTTAVPIPTVARTTATTTADDVTANSYNDNNSSNEYKCDMDNKHFYQRYIDDKNKSINMNNHYFNQYDVLTEKNNSNYSEASSSLCEFQSTELQEKDFYSNSGNNHVVESYNNIDQQHNPYYHHHPQYQSHPCQHQYDHPSQVNQHHENISQAYNYNWSAQNNNNDNNNNHINNYYQNYQRDKYQNVHRLKIINQEITTGQNDSNLSPVYSCFSLPSNKSSSSSSECSVCSKLQTELSVNPCCSNDESVQEIAEMKMARKQSVLCESLNTSYFESIIDYDQMKDYYENNNNNISIKLKKTLPQTSKKIKRSIQSNRMKKLNELKKCKVSTTRTIALLPTATTDIISTVMPHIPLPPSLQQQQPQPISLSTSSINKLKSLPINSEIFTKTNESMFNINAYNIINNITLKIEQNTWNNEFSNNTTTTINNNNNQ
ncbi:unnamed protein product [Trichobilharzia szidati]|nr:unnamed protein product [Trichobilharzia szidati]